MTFYAVSTKRIRCFPHERRYVQDEDGIHCMVQSYAHNRVIFGSLPPDGAAVVLLLCACCSAAAVCVSQAEFREDTLVGLGFRLSDTSQAEFRESGVVGGALAGAGRVTRPPTHGTRHTAHGKWDGAVGRRWVARGAPGRTVRGAMTKKKRTGIFCRPLRWARR